MVRGNKMKKSRIIGCPSAQNISLRRRLTQIIGITPVRVIIPGQEIRGRITEVTSTFFRINNRRIMFNSPFAIDQGFFELESILISVFSSIEGVRKLNGNFVRRGINFIEFEQDLPEDIARWIVPLNRFVVVKCEDSDDVE